MGRRRSSYIEIGNDSQTSEIIKYKQLMCKLGSDHTLEISRLKHRQPSNTQQACNYCPFVINISKCFLSISVLTSLKNVHMHGASVHSLQLNWHTSSSPMLAWKDLSWLETEWKRKHIKYQEESNIS